MDIRIDDVIEEVREDARGARDWLGRLRTLVPLRDGLELTSPPILAAKFLRYAMSLRHKRDGVADDPSARSPDFARLAVDLFRALGRFYFRLEVQGVDNVPARGAVLLVGNHNGAMLPTDAFFTQVAIWDRYGPERAIYALAHDFLFYDQQLRRYALKLGALRAGHENARRVFERGGIVLVYPGSDLETFRAWRDRSRIVLGGRKGFVSLALEAGVPIVPVVSAGTHEQLIVLTRGDRLAKALRMHRWARTDVCPIVASLPWGITTGFLPYLPLPAQTSIAFGPPMTWPELGPGDAHDPAALDRCYAQVETKMQAMLDELTAGRRPFIGRRPAPRPGRRS